jgi:hypothetical protein
MLLAVVDPVLCICKLTVSISPGKKLPPGAADVEMMAVNV